MNLSPIGQKGDFIAKINRDQQEQSAQDKAQESHMGYVNFQTQAVNPDALKILDKSKSEELRAIFFEKIGKKILVALVEPSKKDYLIKNFAGISNYTFEFYVCSQASFEEGFNIYNSDFLNKKKVEISEEIDESQKVLTARLDSFKDLQPKLKSMTTEEVINEIFLHSIATHASDIHIQPEKDEAKLRLRIDGILHTVMNFDLQLAKKIVMGIKYASGMRSNISDIPQDGGLMKNINERSVDLRVSTLPTTKGMESVVIRVLDAERGIKSFHELGFSNHTEKKVLQALYRKNGIVLVTGPTGSGKTTTLYSMLAELNSPERKLVTMEDPIEYHLAGVSQSQVNEEKNFNFETGFKSLLRHDPDVILVGEVRTLATAKLAFEAALTGHTVMTSLHSNHSIGAISRLRNMGLEDYNIAPTISAIFAQKLVRKLCPHCKKSVDYDLENLKPEIERIKKILPNTKITFVDKEETKDSLPSLKIGKISAKFYQACGCPKCSNTGYIDQTSVCEAFLVDEKIRELILNKASESKIKEYLYSKTDFISLFEDGLIKVFAGETSLEELQRVVGK